MRFYTFVSVSLWLLSINCGGNGNLMAASPQGPRGVTANSGFVEGRDYVVLERHRFLDETQFDQPVEAFSLLFPRGWKIEGGVKWLGIGDCRADIVSNVVRAASPDGAISYQVMPSRSFSFASDQLMLQAMQAGAQHGGCGVNQPFDAKRYIDGFARRDLGAQASDIRDDESAAASMRRNDEQANSIARQYGNDSKLTTTMAFGKITWPGGNEGILHAGVSNSISRKPNAFTGGVDTDSVTQVFYCTLIRFPAARREEAAKLFGMIASSYRQNPIWRQAKEEFLTRLGNAEHAQRMETIRLMGERSKAYARAQSQASDARMRDWEGQQAAQEGQHRRFVQTIREVETWQGAEGPVELSSGYKQAWTRGTGRYVMSNNPNFDPSRVFQDQQWREMKRVNP